MLMRGIGIPVAVAFVLLTSGSLLPRLAAPHQNSPYYFVLSLVLGLGATFSAMLAAYFIELLLVGWARSSLAELWKRGASIRLDLVSALAALLPHKYLDFVLSLGLLYFIGTRPQQPSDISLAHWLPTWGLQVGGALLLSSLVSYWIHRLQHAIPAFWSLHQFHHSADRLAIMTTLRGTKLEGALDSVLRILPLAILSTPIASKPSLPDPAYSFVVIYFLFIALTRLNSFLIHSKLDLDYGWVGRWLIVSPRMHRIHHANSAALYNRNFSFDLVLWDRLFGTYVHCDQAALLPVGLVQNPFNSSPSLKGVLRDYFVTTYLEFWRALRGGFKAWVPMPPADDRHAARHTEPGEAT